MSVKIVVDSTVDLTPEVKSRVKVVPLSIFFGEQEYKDGVTITAEKFYEMLVASEALPTTSQPTPAAFEDVYRELVEAGHEVVVITIASKLSGTYQSAMIAVQDYENIYVVDSSTVAIGAGILAELALQLADSGRSAKEIAQCLEREKNNVRIIAMVDTLEYLKRGGRVSKTMAFAGGLLNIKPVLSVVDGEISMLGKARGSRQGNNLLVTEIQKAGGVDFDKPVLLGYTGLSNILLEKYKEDSKALWEHGKTELNSVVIGSVIGTHAGPGAIAAAFFKKEN